MYISYLKMDIILNKLNLYLVNLIYIIIINLRFIITNLFVLLKNANYSKKFKIRCN